VPAGRFLDDDLLVIVSGEAPDRVQLVNEVMEGT
jgi:hypothetical protein